MIGFYVLSVVGFYFSVGLAAAADMIFRGQEATVGDGLAVARSRFAQICGWAALSTAISAGDGRAREPGRDRRPDRRPPGRRSAWSLVTFLAVPVIAIEGTGPFETLKRSAALFRDAGASRSPATSRSAAPSSSSGCCPRPPDRRRRPALVLAPASPAPCWSSLGVIGFAIALLI